MAWNAWSPISSTSRESSPGRSPCARNVWTRLLCYVTPSSSARRRRSPGELSELKADVHDDVNPLLGERYRLLQVLSNLIGNALKFSDAEGKVVVRAANADGTVQVSVKDSGIGIPDNDLARVFDRFWQADRTSRAGAGLGLAICRGIVEAHGGRIWAASAVGRGTTFYFEIPEYTADVVSRA